MTDRATDYRRWAKINYQPVVAGILPERLVPLLRPGSDVLEIGCGDGLVSRYLARAGMNVLGIDLNANAIAAATAAVQHENTSGRVAFQVADGLSHDVTNNFDAVVLIRVLTCLPLESDWRRMLTQCGASLKEDGLIYVHDFAMDSCNPAYSARYEEGSSLGWRRGAFAVRDAKHNIVFVAYHHDEDAIAEVSRHYETVSLSFHDGVSMTGNTVRMFEFIGRAAATAGAPGRGE